MNLTYLRDRIRTNAKTVGLTYTEIEYLADINGILNQTMPCLLWLYEGESDDYETPVTEVILSLYFITNLHDEHKIETDLYQNDYIITERDKLRTYYKNWLNLLQIDTDDNMIKVIRTQSIPIHERRAISGFLAYEMRVTIEVIRNECLDVED